MLKPLVLALSISLGAFAPSALAFQYKVTDLGVNTTWGNGYHPRSINNSGEVLAYYGGPYGNGTDWIVARPAIWNGSSWQVMPDILGREGLDWTYFGEGMNDLGQVAVTTGRTAVDYGEPGDGQWQGFVWNTRTNTVTALNIPDQNNGYGDQTAAMAINNLGTVGGVMGSPHPGQFRAMTWTNGTYTDVSSGLMAGNTETQLLNNQGAMAGQIYDMVTDNSIAMFFRKDAFISHFLMPQGKNDFDLNDINDQGIVVFNVEADCDATGCGRVGYIWNPLSGVIQVVPGTPGQWGSSANGINNLGQVVGQGMDGDQHTNWDSGLLWDPVTGIHSLNESLAPGERYWIWEGYDINDKGVILAMGAHMDDGMTGRLLLLTPVPEPETYALMLAGLGLVGFAARRRQV